MRECITTTSFSVLVNNILGDKFSPSRGIRQGGPLSPYIFILCAKILARQLQTALEDKQSGIGIQACRGAENIPFLTFADDTMIFAKATNNSCGLVKNIISKYYNMLGQKVNFQKSTFQCSKNISANTISNLQTILEIKAVKRLDKYLGCLIINDRVTESTFQPIVERIAKNFSKWKANSISKPGRVTLI